MRIFFVCVFLVVAHLAFSQKNGEIFGVLVDSENRPMEKATVSIVSEHDSLVLSYVLTTDKGRFSLSKVPTGEDLLLHIAHINMNPYFRRLNLKSNEKLDLGTIQTEGITIDEIAIAYHAPIRLNGDTLEYKADYFKTRPNATVEELLRLLPGLQVNADGTILYEGRQVSGIRVNNKDFFIQDITMATRNLDASLVDVVQVIKDKDESKREVLDDRDLPIIINLKTKKEFIKANFGKFYGSGGTRDRYESGALVNTFRDTLQISFIGYANNLSRRGFDYGELAQHGGLSRAENMSMSYMSYGGLQNNVSLGMNANYDIGKILKTNLMYTYDRQDDYVKNFTVSHSFFDDIEERSLNNSNADHTNKSHAIRGLIRYHIDTTARISFNTNIRFADVSNQSANDGNTIRTDGTPVSERTSESLSSNNNNSYRHNFMAEKKLPVSKLVFTLNHNFNKDSRSGFSRNNSLGLFYLFHDRDIDQSFIRTSNGENLGSENSLTVQIPIQKKINLDVYSRYNWSRSDDIEGILNRINSPDFVDRGDIANNKKGDFYHFIYGTQVNIKPWKDVNLTARIERLDLSRNYSFYDNAPNYKDKNSYWQPHISLSYKGTTLSYSEQTRLPAFFYFVAVNSDLYPTSLTVASPYFDNQRGKTVSARYFKFFTKSKLNVNFNVNYSSYDRSIATERTYDTDNSFTTTQNYQAEGNYQIYSFFNLGKTLTQNKIWNIRLQVNGNVSSSNSFSIVNGEENEGRRFNGSINNNIEISYKNNLYFIPNYAFGYYATKNERQTINFRNIENTNHSFGASMRLDNVKKVKLEASYTLRNQAQNIQNDRVNLHLVNASLYYPVLKNKGELKFTAFDILNQNQNIQLGGMGNNNFYMESLTLRQYFMFGLVYKFLTTGK